MATDTPYTPQEYYSQVIKPRERAYISKALGQIARETNSQASAVQSQNLDLSRRLGLSAGFAQAQTQALDAKLREDQAKAVEARRASLQGEVMARRAQAIDELLQRQQAKINETATGVQAATGIAGGISSAIGGALMATPVTAGFGALAMGAGAATSAIGSAASQGIAGEASGNIGLAASRKIKGGELNLGKALSGAASSSFTPEGQVGQRRLRFYEDPNDPYGGY